MSFEQDVIGAIDGIFSLDHINQQDKATIGLIHREVKKLSVEQKQALANFFVQTPLPPDNQMPLLFFLYDCFGDMRFLEALVPFIPHSPSVPWFYEFYWNVSHRLFRQSGSSAALEEALRERFYHLANRTKSFLNSRGLLKKNQISKPPQRIAIIVPQLMNMRHSPTREAYNIALHLKKYHGCETYIINTNGMVYSNCNKLDLLMPAVFEVNETLRDMQQIPVNYMDFNEPISTVSFAAGPMTSQKIANIADALNQLQIDAVIAHGENLLVMESLFGIYPSLFATTGTVVPYQHCDAYFVPETLYNEGTKSTAAKYGHSNFMLESMLVTPEGQAETPALREDFHLTQNDFVFLVVGTRLSGEVDEGFVSVCVRLLEENSEAKVVFAGTNELKLEDHFSASLIANQRVLNIGFQQDLPAICAMCDVYLNPQRLGGGTSSQTAILNGLPVVTLNAGHISAVVPESKCLENWDAYVTYADQLQKDRNYLTSESSLFKQHYYEHLDSAAQIARMHQKLTDIAVERY